MKLRMPPFSWRPAQTISTGDAQIANRLTEWVIQHERVSKLAPVVAMGVLSIVFYGATGFWATLAVIVVHLAGIFAMQWVTTQYNRAPLVERGHPKWWQWHAAACGLLGIGWAFAALMWFDPASLGAQYLLVCVLSVVGLGMVYLRAPLLMSCAASVGPPITAMLTLYFNTADTSNGALPLLLAVYALWLAPCAVFLRKHHWAAAKLLADNETLIGALKESRDRSEAAERAKAQFLGIVSHELRTPLNGILGMAAILEAGDIDANQRKAVGAIRDAGEALTVIIDDLIDLSRLDAGKAEINIQTVSLMRVCDSSLQMLRVKAWEKKIDLTLHLDPLLPPLIRTDAGRLRQILINLVGNAVKFTDTGHVTLRAEPVADDPSGVRLSVEDTGIGIPQDALADLFQPFHQAHKGFSRAYGGTGLGLSIVKRLAALLGGQVGVVSTLGRGSTFWIELPGAVPVQKATAAPEEQPSVGTAMPNQVEASMRQVLVIDDSIHMRRMLTAVLAAGGHVVREASSGLEGIELLGTGATDVILLDLDMPDLDGAATARLIRALPVHQDTPIIAVSGHEQEHVESTGLSELADAVLVKPIAADRLLAEIDRVCALRPVQSQIAAVREPSGAKAASAG